MSLYEKIKNPATGRMVNIYGKLGRNILANFIEVYQSGGEPCTINDKNNCIYTDNDKEQHESCPPEDARELIVAKGGWKNKKGHYGCNSNQLWDAVKNDQLAKAGNEEGVRGAERFRKAVDQVIARGSENKSGGLRPNPAFEEGVDKPSGGEIRGSPQTPSSVQSMEDNEQPGVGTHGGVSGVDVL